jgi:hypothetical protein
MRQAFAADGFMLGGGAGAGDASNPSSEEGPGMQITRQRPNSATPIKPGVMRWPPRAMAKSSEGVGAPSTK